MQGGFHTYSLIQPWWQLWRRQISTATQGCTVTQPAVRGELNVSLIFSRVLPLLNLIPDIMEEALSVQYSWSSSTLDHKPWLFWKVTFRMNHRNGWADCLNHQSGYKSDKGSGVSSEKDRALAQSVKITEDLTQSTADTEQGLRTHCHY